MTKPSSAPLSSARSSSASPSSALPSAAHSGPHRDGEPLLPATRRALLHRLARGQSEGRAPSVVAAVVRDGEVVWHGSRSCFPDPSGHQPDERVQYRIGSITKTFTAVLVMRLRDEGLLDLGDPLGKHLPGIGADMGAGGGAGVGKDTGGGTGRGAGIEEVTVAELLGHSAGLAAETPGPWWERSRAALRPALPDVLGKEPFRHPKGQRHHYSNPGYTVLGALIEKVRGVPWEEALRTEVLVPLGLHRTSREPQAPHAGGWAVHPWADVMMPEPLEDLGLMTPAGGLWSTTADLARFATFLVEGDDRVLGAGTLREMRSPAAPPETADLETGSGYGLGVMVGRYGSRTLVGHAGSLPGFLAGLVISEDDGLAAVVLANCTSGARAFTLAGDLVGIVAEAEPRIPAPWRPLAEVDPAVLELTGPWYWGTQVSVLRLTADGGIDISPLDAGRGARFRPNGDGTWTGQNGYYAGEILRAVRRTDGTVSHLDLGSFVFTREPYDSGAPVPGGVDPDGWRAFPG